MLTEDRPPELPFLHVGNKYVKGPPPLIPKKFEPHGTDIWREDMPKVEFTTVPANPKTLVGATKVPMLSVIPAPAIVRLARALQYGAHFAPRKDSENLGYGPINWRDQNIEYMTYVDAAMRHLLSAADREDIDPDTGDLQVGHLEEAMATIAILIDAREHGTCNDNRPTTARGLVAKMLREMRQK